jgi:hypothetical protein
MVSGTRETHYNEGKKSMKNVFCLPHKIHNAYISHATKNRLQSVNCTVNNLILYFFREMHEIRAETGYPDHDIAVI